MEVSQRWGARIAAQSLAAVVLFLGGSLALAANDAELVALPELTNPAVGPPAPERLGEASALDEGDGAALRVAETVFGVSAEDPERLLSLARHNPEALGSLSLGSPDAGLLFNPVPMPEGDLWTIRNAAESYGTGETITFIVTAITAVETRHPGSPRLVVGDISRPNGGRLNRHRSHQAGRDVDFGFYFLGGECTDFRVARAGELDLPRTWALVRALVTETDVERIFLDRRIQRLLYAHALEAGEDRGWLDDIFGRLGDAQSKGIIQHERRHRNHLHVRFFNRVAQERARVVYATLVETGAVPPPMVKHRVRHGETLGHLAIRYGTRIAAIRAANGIRGSRLRAGRASAALRKEQQEQSHRAHGGHAVACDLPASGRVAQALADAQLLRDGLELFGLGRGVEEAEDPEHQQNAAEVSHGRIITLPRPTVSSAEHMDARAEAEASSEAEGVSPDEAAPCGQPGGLTVGVRAVAWRLHQGGAAAPRSPKTGDPGAPPGGW
jgi:murein endopeptidase